MKRTVTWLHLSDLHACKRDGWRTNRILGALPDDLLDLQKKHRLVPDFIFFTGDLAWGNDSTAKATLAEQFKSGHAFLESIRTTYKPEIPKRRVYLVPGNYDIDRKRITKPIAAYLPGADLKELTEAFRDETEELAGYMGRLEEFGKFLSSRGYTHLAKDKKRLVWADEQVVPFDAAAGGGSVRVGIAGYNSAWSCVGAGDKGNLRLCGEWQHAHLFDQIQDADIRIGLIHHPYNWFKDHVERTVRKKMKEDLHFLLHGHEHELDVDPTKFPTKPPHLNAIIAAGSCYDRDDFPDGYNIVRLDLDSGKGEVFLRRMPKGSSHWSANTELRSAPEGIWPIPCPRLPKPAVAPKPASPKGKAKPVGKSAKATALDALAPDWGRYETLYRAAVVSTYNYLDLPGMTISQEEARNYELEIGYVSLSLAQGKTDAETTTQSAEVLFDYLPDTAPRLIVAGAAGCGKSTLLRWLAVNSCKGLELFPVSNTHPGFGNSSSLQGTINRLRELALDRIERQKTRIQNRKRTSKSCGLIAN